MIYFNYIFLAIFTLLFKDQILCNPFTSKINSFSVVIIFTIILL
ncbi:hypothetical protein FPSM_01312 [Flavobacterium psychrophilum]|nr:hypothetical protein FPSM_01312 [Flavobacterium psychrophilum]